MLLMQRSDSLLSVGMVQAEAHCILTEEAACDGSAPCGAGGSQLKPQTPTKPLGAPGHDARGSQP